MRGVWSTLALVVAAAGLGAYIYFVDSERPDTEAKAKVFAVEADAVEEIRVTAKGETSLLRKTDGTWKLVEPLATDADQNEVSALVNSLADLEENREVEPNAANLAEFGLAEPKADITFKAAGGATGRVRLGDQTPTGQRHLRREGRRHARVPGRHLRREHAGAQLRSTCATSGCCASSATRPTASRSPTPRARRR